MPVQTENIKECNKTYNCFLWMLLERHVLKPETTKRNGRNETSETTETSKILRK